MKRNVAFWIVIFLVNAVIGVAGVKIYQNMDARIASLETQGVDGKYDFNNNLIKIQDLNKFFDYKAYVRTEVSLEAPEELKQLSSGSEKSIVEISEAPAVIIGRYVLMASHVSDAEISSQQTVMIQTPFGVFGKIFKFKVLENKMALLLADGSEYPLKELYRNKKEDFSLFEFSENGNPDGIVGASAPNFPFKIGESGELKIGNFIYLNGRPKIRSEVARPGFVTSLTSAFLDEKFEVKKNDNGFGLSQSTDKGDSGSPIVAFRDGQPELVGIYLGWFGLDGDNGLNTRSRALKINLAVDEIKEKLGIDLRELQRQTLSPKGIS